MLPIWGSPKRLCNGLTRRDLLHIGGLGLGSFGLADWMRLQAATGNDQADEAPSFGRARSSILIFLFGSPPQHETFDPKPLAPKEVQGDFAAIPTSVAGLEFCEHLPRCAQIADRTTVIRSMTHPYPVHGVAYAVTGMPTYTPAIEAKPRDPQHWPFMGSVVDYLAQQASRKPPEVPRNIALPWQMGSKCDLGLLAGPYSAFLGTQYDPIWTDFDGEGTAVVPKLSDGQGQDVKDPFGGTVATGRFRLSAAAPLDGVTSRRLDARQILLRQFDDSRNWLNRHAGVQSYDEQQQQAYSLLSSAKVRDALDLSRESNAMRERYGMTLFGQSLLAARRLVQSGVKFVSVFWDPYALFGGSVWDTHANHFPRLKDYLLPVFDQSFAALIRDLDEQGLLDETLVNCMSEHGRTPKIDNGPKGGGRHHWSNVYSAIMAGGGIARGRVVGRSDPHGGEVAQTPVSPKDIQATTYHLLGIPAHTMMPDQLGRPLHIAGSGIVRHELLG